jgi:short-subunit dehydrogenase
MSKTIVLLGAGSGLGAAVARRFGKQGYQVAVVARRTEPLAELVDALGDLGVTAQAFPADLTDLDALPALFDRIRGHFTGIDVLYFGAATSEGFTAAEELTARQVADFAALYTYPPIAAVQAVLPEMLSRGDGSILYVGGGTAIQAPPTMSGPAPAVAAARNYLQTLHAEVGARGVYVGALFVAAMIAGSAAHAEASKWDTDGKFPVVDPDDLADILWRLHTDRSSFERMSPPHA